MWLGRSWSGLRGTFWAGLLLVVLVLTCHAPPARAQDDPVVRLVYFTSSECPICHAVVEEVLNPLQAEYSDRLEIKMVDINNPSEYEMLVYAEEMFEVTAEDQGIPMLVIGGEVLIGDEAIREQLPCLLSSCEQAGTAWPDIPGLERIVVEGDIGFDVGFDPGALSEGDACTIDESETCDVPTPIWAAYFYEAGCQQCSRAEYTIRYAESQYPQLLVDEYDINEETQLAEWLGLEFGVPEEVRLATPTLFIGGEYLIGEGITDEALLTLAERYADTGTERVWADFNPEEAEESIIERFKSFGLLTIILAGLGDGLNPCAFATMVFFVSYLSISGRQGREILAVGGAFTLGVFLAYLLVGLGFYQVLSLLGDLLATLGRWVYGLTAVLCGVLAVLSLLDFAKARRGDIGDMALNLPHALRMRINAVIRKGRGARAFVLVSFVTGVAISFLELACTGQVYLPTIVFVVSQPELRVQAVGALVLYNLMFILPLVVVFVLAYQGTGSKQLTCFLERHAATVKLGLAILFAALAVWLIASVWG